MSMMVRAGFARRGATGAWRWRTEEGKGMTEATFEVEYPHLRAWCALMGSYSHWVRLQLSLAREDSAPQDVIYHGPAEHQQWLADRHQTTLADDALFFHGKDGRVWTRWVERERPELEINQAFARYLDNVIRTGSVLG